MPNSFNIIHAVRRGLDDLQVDGAESNVVWTQAIKTELCRIGRREFPLQGRRALSRGREVRPRLWRMALRRHLARIRRRWMCDGRTPGRRVRMGRSHGR